MLAAGVDASMLMHHMVHVCACLRLAGQVLSKQLQLSLNGIEVAHRVRAAAVNDVHQHPCALTVPQKLVPKAPACMRPLQQTCINPWLARGTTSKFSRLAGSPA